MLVTGITRLCWTGKTPRISEKNTFTHEYVKHKDDRRTSAKHESTSGFECSFIKGKKKNVIEASVFTYKPQAFFRNIYQM